MKVLFFARDFAPQIGGVQNFLARLAETFDPEDILVLTRKTDGWKKHDSSVSYPIVRMPSFESWPRPVSIALRSLLSLIYVFVAIRQHRPDLMICGYAKGNAPYGWLAKKLFGIRYVVFAYGTDVVRYRGKYTLVKKWLAEADLVAAISQHVHRFVEEFTNHRAKVVTIPLGSGVSGDAPDPPLNEWNGVDLSGKKLILTVCRLTRRKGVDNTIEAVVSLVQKHPDIIYSVVGDGEDREMLEQLIIEKQISNHVIFTGRVSDEDLLRFYARADVFVLASREEGRDIEGFGLVFVEAGAFGVPVIGGDSGGVREAVSHDENGLLVDPNRPEAIAEAIEKLLLDKNLAEKYGREGKRRATEIFTWENCKETLLSSLDN